MAGTRLTDEQMDGAVAAVAGQGSLRKAAAAVGLPLETFKSRFTRALAEGRTDPRPAMRAAARAGELGGPPIPDAAVPPEGFAVVRNGGEYDAEGNLVRQWVGTRAAPSAEDYAVPAGHVVKGESTLLTPDGKVMQRWVKTREAGGGEALVDGLRQAFAEFRGAAPVAPVPDMAADELLTVYPLPDLHLGMYAWGRETGADYDTEIAVANTLAGVSGLVAQSRPSTKAVLLGLGDYFHANDQRNMTPTSGHVLDVDGRWSKVFAAGARLAVAIVDLLSRRHREVEVVFLPGNHDLDAAVSLTVAMALFFESNPRIAVHQEPGVAWFSRFGRVLLGATHGHTMKPLNMALMLAADRPEDWGQTDHRHFYFGHVHHETAKEVGAVRVESFSTPAARDAYGAGTGHRAGRALSAITFHREHGEIGRHRVNITAARPRVRVAAGTSDT